METEKQHELHPSKSMTIAVPTEQPSQVEQNVAEFLHEAGLAEAVMQDRYFSAHIDNADNIKLLVEAHDRDDTRAVVLAQYNENLDGVDYLMNLTVSDRGLLAFEDIKTNEAHSHVDRSVANHFVQTILDQGFAEAAREKLEQKTDVDQVALDTPSIQNVIDKAHYILDRVGTPNDQGAYFQGTTYRLQSTNNSLTVQTEERGEILKVEGDQVVSSGIIEADNQSFSNFSSQLETIDMQQSPLHPDHYQANIGNDGLELG